MNLSHPSLALRLAINHLKHAAAFGDPLRVLLYKAVARVRAGYCELAQNLEEAGCTVAQVATFEQDAVLRGGSSIKNYSGEQLDIKPFKADMRHLINS